MAQFQVSFTGSTGLKERQSAGERETVALLRKLPRLGAANIHVLTPAGETWTREEAIRQLTEV